MLLLGSFITTLYLNKWIKWKELDKAGISDRHTIPVIHLNSVITRCERFWRAPVHLTSWSSVSRTTLSYYLRSQHFFEVVMFFDVWCLLFPSISILSKRHPDRICHTIAIGEKRKEKQCVQLDFEQSMSKAAHLQCNQWLHEMFSNI